MSPNIICYSEAMNAYIYKQANIYHSFQHNKMNIRKNILFVYNIHGRYVFYYRILLL